MDTEHILTIFGLVFASTGFWTFINSWIERKTKKKSDAENGILALLHDKIYYLAKKHIAEGSITDAEHKNLIMLYEPYRALGGNGTAEKLMKEVDKLPISDD